MKKVLAFFFPFLLILCIFAASNSYGYSSYPDSGISINVNGQRIYPDVPPVIQNDRTLVPVRGIFEKMGADVQWHQDEQKAVVNYKDITIELRPNNNKAIINGITKEMDVPPLIYNERTLIPLRFISENIGMNVQWIQEAKLATITDPNYYNNLPAVNVMGYTTNDYVGDNGPFNSLKTYGANLTTVATFSYQVDWDGSLIQTGQKQSNAVEYANANNIRPLLLIHNFLNGKFNKELSHSVLANISNRQNLINNIVLAMSKEAYSGVNIDIESIYYYDRQNYTDFVKDLKSTLTQYGYLTTLSVPSKTFNSYSGDNWSGAFDYNELGKSADLIMVMTYDEHTFGGDSGPVASYNWVDNVLRYATQTMPSSKVLLGLAGYGYDWSSAGDRAIPFKNIPKLISDYNAETGWNEFYKSPFLHYTKNGVEHEVWYENTESISIKLDFVSKYQLGGIGLWKLGFDNDELWNTIKEKININ